METKKLAVSMEKLKLTKELKEFLENEGELGDGHSVV